MSLSESLVWALESYDISGVKVMCEEAIRDEASKFFLNVFKSKWNEALDRVEEENGDCETKEEEYFPVSVRKTEYGFFIEVGALEIRYCYGNYYEPEYGADAFEQSLKEMKGKYSGIEYEGYIGYPVSDVHGGEASQWELSSTKHKKNEDVVYDFVGNVLNAVLNNEEYAPEEPVEAEDLVFVVTGKLKYFENREEITEYIEDLGASVSGSVSKKTSYLINNDANSSSSKNQKAKELGVPIITEREFILKFGDPGEYDIEVPESDFWCAMADQLECNEDFEETIETLYAYSQFIEKTALDRGIRSIVDIADTIDEDMHEELIDLVKKLEAGETIVHEDDHEGNLPDGYMEALEMFMKAEELGAPKAKRGEVVSSEGTFDIVIAKAEEGDSEAKFTAGKYFLADHITEETDRAIRWIKEAAEEGVEDADEYIASHKELF